MPSMWFTKTIEVPDDEAIGEAIRAERLRRGLRLVDVCAHCEYSKSYLGNLENGRKPWTRHLYRVFTAAMERASAPIAVLEDGVAV